MPRPTVLVLGANGRFGAAAVQAFTSAGWQVLAPMRRPPAVPLPAGTRVLDAPLRDTAGLAARAAGARTVVYAVNPLYTRWDTEALPLARLGMDVAERLGARFMLPGNVYNFGQGMPALLREDTPQRPSTPKGQLRCELEAEIRERCARGGMQGVVLRAGDFYGAGSGSWFDQVIVKSIAKGRLVYPGPLDVAHAWAYLPDLARAFVALASREGAPAFEQFHFAGHTLSGAELLAAVEAAAGELGLCPAGAIKVGAMPWGLIRTVGVVYPLWRELARMSYLWHVPHALDGAALARALGPLPATPVVDAVRQALVGLGLTPLSLPQLRPPGPALD
ncbi:MAG: NAD-dependent epimerase/dehydratase family protein [Rubrivivax sp.]|nr:NAD-dependent epimerase/dehydratase family protein [Rubrivivax sp.]